jgi:hypothetical protein
MNHRTAAPTLPLSAFLAPRSALAGAMALPVLLVAAQLSNPKFDPSWRPISEYAIGRHGWVMTLAFLAWGLAPLALATTVRRHVTTRGGRIGLGLLVLGAAGPLLAAVFPMDPSGAPAGPMTTAGAIHAGSAVLGDFIPIAALVLSLVLTRKDGLWEPFRVHLLAGAGAAMAMLVASAAAMGAMMPESGQLGPEVQVGWIMRASVVSGDAWVAMAAWASLRSVR